MLKTAQQSKAYFLIYSTITNHKFCSSNVKILNLSNSTSKLTDLRYHKTEEQIDNSIR